MKSWTHLNVRALRTLTKLLLLPTSKHHPILTSTHHPILTSTHHPLLTSTHHPLLTSTHPLLLTCLLRIPSNILLTPPQSVTAYTCVYPLATNGRIMCSQHGL